MCAKVFWRPFNHHFADFSSSLFAPEAKVKASIKFVDHEKLSIESSDLQAITSVYKWEHSLCAGKTKVSI
jgi:hypothetical protein